MTEIQGMLVESRAGHDKGEIYVLTEWDDNYVYLANGDNRKLISPKKKKRKHVAKVGNPSELLAEQLTDDYIRRVIKLWRSNNV